MICIKYDTVAALRLVSQISDNNINVRTTNGQDIGIRGSVLVNFKIGPTSFTHKLVVSEGLMNHLFYERSSSAITVSPWDGQTTIKGSLNIKTKS